MHASRSLGVVAEVRTTHRSGVGLDKCNTAVDLHLAPSSRHKLRVISDSGTVDEADELEAPRAVHAPLNEVRDLLVQSIVRPSKATIPPVQKEYRREGVRHR